MADMLRYNTDILDSVSQKLHTLSSEMAACNASVSQIASRMNRASGSDLRVSLSSRLSMGDMKISSSDVVSCLNQYARALDKYQAIAAKLGSNVHVASDMFLTTENALCSMSIETGEQSPYADSNSGSGSPSIYDAVSAMPPEYMPSVEPNIGYDWKGLLLKALSKAGTFGSVTSALLGLKGDAPQTLLNYLVRAGDASVKWAKGLFDDSVTAGDYAKDIFGLSKYLKTPSSARGFAAFKENFGSAFKSGMTKPVSWITAAISSGVNNYQEFGGKITDRVVVEWVTETAATVATGAASAALVGAAFAAAGISAQALVVGAVGVVAYAGVDALWANTLGNGTGIVESIGHATGEIYDGAKNLISSAGDWLGDKLDGLSSGLNISALWA